MLFTTLIAAALLSIHTHAASTKPTSDFEITDLTILCVASANITLEFTVYDPDPLTNATAVCTGTWKAGTKDYPQGSYELCGNSTFAWNMARFSNAHNFTLGLEHAYEDPNVGQPPYDHIVNFAKANVSEPAITCEATSGHLKCDQEENTTIEAPIYASIAKRR